MSTEFIKAHILLLKLMKFYLKIRDSNEKLVKELSTISSPNTNYESKILAILRMSENKMNGKIFLYAYLPIFILLRIKQLRLYKIPEDINNTYFKFEQLLKGCLLYTSPSPRDRG